MNVTEIIHRYASLDPRSIDQTRVESLLDIGSSILFVLAVWSGPSIAAFKRLTEHLAILSTRPRLLVCDIDELPDEMRISLGHLHGVGETFWVHDGNILASLTDYKRDDWSEIVSRYCDHLLQKQS
ncbi:MAG: hypothetical protein MUE69_16745 [Myxococcota bacterium]|jgi:hypothetical protein|nr:hypothetical protein [Myxococcota bacterium]